jgi:hypothetical protein
MATVTHEAGQVPGFTLVHDGPIDVNIWVVNGKILQIRFGPTGLEWPNKAPFVQHRLRITECGQIDLLENTVPHEDIFQATLLAGSPYYVKLDKACLKLQMENPGAPGQTLVIDIEPNA